MVKVLKARMQEIDLTLIDFGNGETLKLAEAKDVEELAREIHAFGMRQPIMVRPKGERFGLVVGIRRYLAHTILGRERISCVVAELNEGQCSLARAVHKEGGLYLVLTPKGVVFSLGVSAFTRNPN